MVNSLLIELLKHFSAAEMREFRLFVASPYFNRGVYVKKVVALLTFLKKSHPDFAENHLDRRAAYRAVFPKESFVEGKLDKVMSELHLLAKQFVGVQRYTRPENDFHLQLDQMVFYRTRGLENRFEHLKQRLLRLQAEAPFHNEAFFRQAFLLNYEIYNSENLHNQTRGDLHIPPTLQTLDLYYFFLKTELLNTYLLQQKLTQVDIPPEMLRSMEESELPHHYADTYPVLLISHSIFRLLEQKHTSLAEFESVHALVKAHEREIDPALLRFYLTYIRNFCSLLYNGGQSELLSVLFKLQKDHLERGYLYYDYYGYKVAPSTFLNICSTAFKLKEHEWARAFIEAHRDRIMGDNEARDYYRLGRANYLFVIGQYNQAIDEVPSTFQEIDYLLYARRLEMKIYYEMNSDLLSYKIDAFKMYLSRISKKVLSPKRREVVGNFVNLLFQLCSIRKGDTKRALRIIERIRAKQAVAERDWLIEKAEALM